MKINKGTTSIKDGLEDMTLFVKKIVILTQAEYDALPSSKNSNNTLYLIKG